MKMSGGATLVFASWLAMVVFSAAAPAHADPLSDLPGHLHATGEHILTHQHLTGQWWAVRDAIETRGIAVEASLIADWSWNLRGGASTNGNNFRRLFDLNITVNAETLLEWQGGTFYFDFYNHHGPNASADLTGDVQAFDNIDADGRTQVAELWFEQLLLNDRLRIKVGKVDANSEFAYVEHGSEFIHSSAGYSPTNANLPSYPEPAASINVFIYPHEQLYLGVGVYDGAAQEGVRTGEREGKTFFGDPADLYLIGEVGVAWQWRDELPGRLGVGAWKHTGTFAHTDGTSPAVDNAEGLYIVFDQWLWREAGQQGIGAFAQFGVSDDDASPIDLHIGGGIAWTGMIPGRDDDVTGVMFSYAHFANPARNAGVFTDDYEMAVETFYKLQLTPTVSIKPDLQYIANPGGVGLSDALASTLRVEVIF